MEYLKVCKSFASEIQKNESEIFRILTKYESHETVKDEISRSLYTLTHINEESGNFPTEMPNKYVALLPLNLPLYSYVLFVLIPSLYCKKVVFRVPTLMTETIKELEKFIPMPSNVSCKIVSRNVFLKDDLMNADVIVYTGKYENAWSVLKEVGNNKLFLFNGRGINPVIVYNNADLEKAVEKSVFVKLFNSGQDCAGPDAFLIQDGVFDGYLKLLINKLKNVNIGGYDNPLNIVGPLVSPDSLISTANYLLKYQYRIVYGGRIDYSNNIVEPVVLKSDISDKRDYTEQFAPIFNLISFNKEKDLDSYFKAYDYVENAMYASVFGDNPYTLSIERTEILHDQVIHDVEVGTKEYGGYGTNASFVFHKGKKYPQPILISREIKNFYNK